jgi:carbamoyl-phosphate synthase large subunit
MVKKVYEGSPHVVDALRAGRISLVINNPADAKSVNDSLPIRRVALECGVPYFTTIAAAAAAVEGIEHLRAREFSVRALQEHHACPPERPSSDPSQSGN